MRKIAAGLIIVSVFAAGAVAQAAAPWKVFASSSDNDEYYSSASADATVQAPNALAIRVIGSGVEDVDWRVSCEFEKDPAKAGVYVISVANADSCNVYGSAAGEGKITYQLLRK
jgi:hypothetical protein